MTNEYGHGMNCDCQSCIPLGAGKDLPDILAAAKAEMLRQGIRGEYVTEPHGCRVVVEWRSPMGGRADITRDALRVASELLREAGEVPVLVGLALCV